MRRFTCVFLVLALMSCMVGTAFAMVESSVKIFVDNERVNFDLLNQRPIIENDGILVPVRAVTDLMGCQVDWNNDTKVLKIFVSDCVITLAMGDVQMLVEKSDGIGDYVTLDAAPVIINDRVCMPIRAVAESLGATVKWYGITNTIIITTSEDVDKVNGHTYYFQNQEKWQLPNYGNSYCWVCAYAMLLNDVVGNVTPVDVMNVNLKYCDNGAYCYHYNIVSDLGAMFVPALSSDSEYFGSYSTYNGATYIKNESKDEDTVRKAIKEALDLHPKGVLVRFTGANQHTIVATHYDSEYVYFTDPLGYGGYAASNKYANIKFESTFLGMRKMSLTELEFIQAIEKN